MSSTTKKHRRFVSEPMGDRPVKDLPGIGDVLATRMKAAGVDRADMVLGHYLALNKDRQRFQRWMKNSFDAAEVHSYRCYNAIAEWYDNFGQ